MSVPPSRRGTGKVFTHAGVNQGEMVATGPDARGRGYGAAVTARATFADPGQPAVLIASDDGRPVYTVKVNTEQAAIDRLQTLLGKSVTVARAEPVYDTTGSLVAYSIWIAR